MQLRFYLLLPLHDIMTTHIILFVPKESIGQSCRPFSGTKSVTMKCVSIPFN